MKKVLGSLLAAGLILAGCSSSGGEAKDLSTVKIGAIQLVQHAALDKAYDGFKDVLVEAGIKEDQIDFQNAGGDQSNCQTIAEKFVNDQVDLIYAIATPAVQAAANKTDTIPVVGSAVTNFETAGVVESNEKPGKNVTGTSDINPVEGQIQLLQKLVPSAKKIAIFYNGAEANSVYQGELAIAAAKDAGLEAEVVTVSESNDIQAATEKIAGAYDAAYIPTDNLLAENMTTVSQVANEKGLPTIVGESNMCENGGLATLGLDYYEVGKLAGQQALDILNGKSTPADMPIASVASEDCKYCINVTTAKKLGIEIPSDLEYDEVK